MKTIKRITALGGTVALAGVLLTPSAFAATGVLPAGMSAGDGRDHGHGNCGYNNGGATKLSGEELRLATGMGGHKKGETCQREQAEEEATVVEESPTTESTTTPEPTTPEPTTVELTAEETFHV